MSAAPPGEPRRIADRTAHESVVPELIKRLINLPASAPDRLAVVEERLPLRRLSGGGGTDRTARLSSSSKERLLVSGIGSGLVLRWSC